MLLRLFSLLVLQRREEEPVLPVQEPLASSDRLSLGALRMNSLKRDLIQLNSSAVTGQPSFFPSFLNESNN